MALCRRCGQPTEADAKFCHACGSGQASEVYAAVGGYQASGGSEADNASQDGPRNSARTRPAAASGGSSLDALSSAAAIIESSGTTAATAASGAPASLGSGQVTASGARVPGSIARTPGSAARTPGSAARTPGSAARTPGSAARVSGSVPHAPGSTARAPGSPATSPGSAAHASRQAATAGPPAGRPGRGDDGYLGYQLTRKHYLPTRPVEYRLPFGDLAIDTPPAQNPHAPDLDAADLAAADLAAADLAAADLDAEDQQAQDQDQHVSQEPPRAALVPSWTPGRQAGPAVPAAEPDVNAQTLVDALRPINEADYGLPPVGQTHGTEVPTPRHAAARARAYTARILRAEPGPRDPRLTAAAATVAVLVIAGAVVTLLLSNHHPAAGRTQASRTSAAAKPSAHASTGGTAPAHRHLVTTALSVGPSPDTTATVTFLTKYFSAINKHNYLKYQHLFSAGLRGGLSESAFVSGYGSSHDSHIVLRSISVTGPGEIDAIVSFTSHQQAASSPTKSACTAWSITLYLVKQDHRYLVQTPPHDYQPSAVSCS